FQGFQAALSDVDRYATNQAFGGVYVKWTGADLNRRPVDFQSTALPTELPVLPTGPSRPRACRRELRRGTGNKVRRISRLDQPGPASLPANLGQRPAPVNRFRAPLAVAAPAPTCHNHPGHRPRKEYPGCFP